MAMDLVNENTDLPMSPGKKRNSQELSVHLPAGRGKFHTIVPTEQMVVLGDQTENHCISMKLQCVNFPLTY